VKKKRGNEGKEEANRKLFDSEDQMREERLVWMDG
jgi:hypothetical protein